MERNGMLPPPGWGQDHLTSTLEGARRNQFATFFNKADEFSLLRELDRCFLLVLSEWTDPTNHLAAILLGRSHSAFIAASGLAMAGQIAESYPVARVVLEYAAYAVHIDTCPELEPIWWGRHKAADGVKAVRKSFGHEGLLKSMRARDAALTKKFEALYERTINFGAHPNEMAVTSNLSMAVIEKGRLVNIAYLHEDSKILAHGLKTSAQAALCSLLLFRTISQDRFDSVGVTGNLRLLESRL